MKGGEDVSFLSELLQSKQLHALVHVHNKIVAKGKDERFFPLLSNSMEVALEVLELISETPFVDSSCREELFKLLQTPHMQVITSGLFIFHKSEHITDRIMFQGDPVCSRRDSAERLLSTFTGSASRQRRQ